MGIKIICINERQRARLYIYIKQNKMRNVIYIQISRHFVNSKTICVAFLFTKAWHFTLRNFHEFFEIGIYIYTKSMTLFVTWRFYIQKYTHFEKFKTIWITFFYTKSLTLYVTQFFMGFLKLAEGGEGYEQEIMHFSLIRLYAKNNALPDTFYKKPETLRHFLIFKTKCTLCYVLYLKCMV